jgi:L,D-transpeptidase catalytic domain
MPGLVTIRPTRTKVRIMRIHYAACIAVFAIVASAVPASANVLISVDKSAQRMTVTVDGAQRYAWPVSTGRGGYATPSGSFRTFRMEEDHFSKEWDDAPMPHSIFFTTEGHAIHGSYDVNRLGTAVSHGCVRLAPANAAKLFALVKEEGLSNTKVVLTGNAPAAAPLVAKRKPRRPQDDEEDAAYAPRGNGPYDGQQPVWGQPAYGQQGYPPVTEQPRPRWPFPFFN